MPNTSLLQVKGPLTRTIDERKLRGPLTKGIGVSGFIGLFQELAANNSVTCFIIVRFLQGLGRFSKIHSSRLLIGCDDEPQLD